MDEKQQIQDKLEACVNFKAAKSAGQSAQAIVQNETYFKVRKKNARGASDAVHQLKIFG